MELRKYQADLLKKCHLALLDSQAPRVMMQLPTGGGKTRIAGKLLFKWLKYGRKAVWLTHRRELVTQTLNMLREDSVRAKEIPWIPGTKAPSTSNGVVILMAQTVTRRLGGVDIWGSYSEDDLMIIDEAHHAAAPGYAKAMSQWKGPVLGMTATPWRLSTKEGFDHLFNGLICGPQVENLQSDGWLCNAKVLSPPEDELILGGQVDSTGEYFEAGIEEANRDRQVWTAGALRFWEQHAKGRPTIVYAVSVNHAKNLVDVFDDAEIPSDVLLGETKPTERQIMIGRFKQGNLKVLVNVAVATEGFDLPDASCVLLTRPTMSLALYLQMVGRGMRPKPDSGNCLILDMAGNTMRHGLPEEDKEWSLRPRGEIGPPGEAPLIRCEKCEALSAASSHKCTNCGRPFGEECGRCGAWRAWKRWDLRNWCGTRHQLVCDFCHYDAHIEANLPVTEELEELRQITTDAILPADRDPFLKNLLEKEIRQALTISSRKEVELLNSIKQLESYLRDDDEMHLRYESHIASLPFEQRPSTFRQKAKSYAEWEKVQEDQLEAWEAEIESLKSQPMDGAKVFSTVREKVLRMLATEARELGLITDDTPQSANGGSNSSNSASGEGEWITLFELSERSENGLTDGIKPRKLRFPNGEEPATKSWRSLIRELSEYLIREELLTNEKCPILVRRMTSYLIHREPKHPSGRPFGNPIVLSNRLYLNSNLGSRKVARGCALLVEDVGGDPGQIMVQVPLRESVT